MGWESAWGVTVALKMGTCGFRYRAAAIIVETTDENSHAVVTGQALGIPVFMDRFHVSVHMLKDGTTITVDADKGFIFNGVVK